MNDDTPLKPQVKIDDEMAAILICELHDGPCQQITAALYHLMVARGLQSANPADFCTAFDRGINLLRRGLWELRNVVSGAGPICVEGQSLTDAIEKLVREHADGHSLQVTFRYTPGDVDVPVAVQTKVLRIVQEGLRNVQRHSGSSTADIAIAIGDNVIHVEVKDEGHGFDPTEIRGDCFGITGMRARAVLAGGTLSITSAPGEGTLLAADIPLARRSRGLKGRKKP
jgi:signal transduction histidine kinase